MATEAGRVLAADYWSSNAHLIADVARLGYLRESDYILDTTYGDHGVWWKRWKPLRLNAPSSGFDFTKIPFDDDNFDAVTYDPPYVVPGGRETSNMKEMYARYGQLTAPRNPEEGQKLINAGLSECARVVKPSATKKMDDVRCNGVVLVKCADYIWSGQFWPGRYYTEHHAHEIGLAIEDRFEYCTKHPRPQPERSRKCPKCMGATGGCEMCESDDGRVASKQCHAASNISTLFVFRKINHGRMR